MTKTSKSKKEKGCESPNTKWYTERVTTENIQQQHYCQAHVKQKKQPYNADFTVDKAQPSYHWCHI